MVNTISKRVFLEGFYFINSILLSKFYSCKNLSILYHKWGNVFENQNIFDFSIIKSLFKNITGQSMEIFKS